ncbi:MAG: hopanoid biosynthesis-associated protein HpnK [Candidatus Binatia bacterium]
MSRTPGRRRLIVSGDDFGMSPGVNAGIIAAHRNGILTDASLMVNAAALVEAVELARATPTLAVGLHLVLVQGRAISTPHEVPGLVDAAGMFRNNSVAAGLRYFFTPGMRAQIEHEVSAQLEKYRRTGLPLSHVDGHLNIHMHPSVLAILLRLAPRYGVRAMRLPREPWQISLQLDRRERRRKLIEALIFRNLTRYARPRLAAQGIRHPDQLFGLHQSGHVNEPYLLGILNAAPTGVTEVYCHPALTDDEARRWRPADYESEAELAALTSPRVHQALRASGIERLSYEELASSG